MRLPLLETRLIVIIFQVALCIIMSVKDNWPFFVDNLEYLHSKYVFLQWLRPVQRFYWSQFFPPSFLELLGLFLGLLEARQRLYEQIVNAVQH